MRFNLHWAAIKQLRLSHWIYDKLFNIGLAIHVYRKYGKFNPNVIEIMAHANGGKLPRYYLESIQHNEEPFKYWGGGDPDFVIPDHVLVSNYNDDEGLTRRIQVALQQAHYNLQFLQDIKSPEQAMWMKSLASSANGLMEQAQALDAARQKLRRKK